MACMQPTHTWEFAKVYVQDRWGTDQQVLPESSRWRGLGNRNSALAAARSPMLLLCWDCVPGVNRKFNLEKSEMIDNWEVLTYRHCKGRDVALVRKVGPPLVMNIRTNGTNVSAYTMSGRLMVERYYAAHESCRTFEFRMLCWKADPLQCSSPPSPPPPKVAPPSPRPSWCIHCCA